MGQSSSSFQTINIIKIVSIDDRNFNSDPSPNLSSSSDMLTQLSQLGLCLKHYDPNDIYNKYWLAMANEAAGNKDKAMSLFKEVAAYNFNDVGNALVRNEVKKKVAM